MVGLYDKDSPFFALKTSKNVFMFGNFKQYLVDYAIINVIKGNLQTF